MLKDFVYKLLRRSEKYTRTDMVYLAKGGFWLSVGQGISATASFVLAIIFANLLPKETYGDYKYILSVAALIGIFTLPGINTAVTQSIAKGEKISVKDLTLYKIKYGLIASLISLGIALYYFLNDRLYFSLAFIAVAMFLPLAEAFTLYSATLNGRQLFKKITGKNSIVKILHSLIILGVIFVTKNIFIITLIYFVGLLMSRYLVSYLTAKEIPDDNVKNQPIKKYGLALTIAESVNTLSAQADKLLVYLYLGPVQLAIYFMAITPVDQVKQIVKNIVPLTLPKLSQRSAQELDKSLSHKLIMTAILGSVLMAIYIILAPFFFKYFVPQYISSMPFSILFSIMILLQSISSVMASLLRSQKMIDIIQKNTWVQNISLIVLMFCLGYYYGIFGIIIAKLLSMLISIILRTCLWKKAVNKKM
ncbi:MAG: hypothetical protein A2406_04585 [Candidatus Komeilibacteria bacterium RIFOXYC1_FULL_37_11]|uniref:Polysaccharide biosynthesis protein C-terminal domain-containing protein n=1 Tax=Candidatus Komeilibacteria bacterium RIFOXYC1_FULL_37_11 TaxID=1798555 RepID=A0A1G2C0A1_9BACT|nr:MAG: hypothetical protein A2406_04585 [Candidatus Komeilibacteria bacterium RIFOXYC1_FULL_37_11]OGY95391.1 MAG: hypothetical protein A2611_01685 [Candidatus Komeilibacteria bacterium RIFOXYD1_FULL_37_29]